MTKIEVAVAILRAKGRCGNIIGVNCPVCPFSYHDDMATNGYGLSCRPVKNWESWVGWKTKTNASMRQLSTVIEEYARNYIEKNKEEALPYLMQEV